MKKLKTLAILLLIITALHAIANEQEFGDGQLTVPTSKKNYDKIQSLPVNGIYKVQIPNTDKAWIFSSLDDNKKVFTLIKDTLYIHKKIDEPIKEQSKELRYLRWRNKVYRYQFAIYDYAYFHGNRKGIEIY